MGPEKSKESIEAAAETLAHHGFAAVD